MASKKPGQYWDKSWNPIKIKGGGYHYDNRDVEYVLDEKVLQQLLGQKIPTTYFVCDLCDLFHEQVPFGSVNQVMNVVRFKTVHTFLFLTKRVKRMAQYFSGWVDFPYPSNLHLGVSISNQAEANKRYLGVFFNIDQFVEWWNYQDDKCYYCQRTFEEIKNAPDSVNRRAKRLTIDRADNSVAYTLPNLRLACYRCNLIKGDYFTEKEMLQIGKIIRAKEHKRICE